MKKVVCLWIVGIVVISGFIGAIIISSEIVEGIGLADSPWPCFHGNASHTGLSPYNTSNIDGTLLWQYNIHHSVAHSLAIDSNGTIYFGSENGYLYALNSDGTLKWTFYTGYIHHIHSTPAIDSDGTIYFGCQIGLDNGKVYAIFPNGTQKWNYTTGETIVCSSPAIDRQGIIYIGTYGGNLFSLYPDGTLKWKYKTGDVINSSPAIGNDGTIYVGSFDNKIYALNRDGTLKWSYTTGMAVISSPAIGDDGTIYIGSKDFKLYALNSNGAQKWNFTTGAEINSSPAIGKDGTIYIGSDDFKIYAINPNGTQKWSYTTGNMTGSSPAIGDDGTVYIGSYDSRIYAIYPNGTLKWSYAMTSFIGFNSPAIGSDGTVYMPFYRGGIYAFGSTEILINNTADYYQQLCLRFIHENFPIKRIERVSSYNTTSIETNYQYTILNANLMPGSSSPSGDPVTVSIRHDTLNIEFGRDQINSDWDEYYNALPDYYKKIDQESRLHILHNLSYLPLANDQILANYSTEVLITFDPASIDLVERYLNNYDYLIDVEDGSVTGNFTLATIVSLCNEPYVNAAYFSTIYDCAAQSEASQLKQVSTLLILFIILLSAIIVIMILRSKVSKYKK